MKRIICILLIVLFVLTGCGSSNTQQQTNNTQNNQTETTKPAEPAPEPAKPETSFPDFENKVYEGSGDDVIDVEQIDGGYVFYIKGNDDLRYFSVKGYDSNNDLVDIYVSSTDKYEGIVTGRRISKVVTLEISSTCDWHIEQRSFYTLDTISQGETKTGNGDSVLRVLSFDKTASVSGNSDSRYFSIKEASNAGYLLDIPVSTTDEYEGKIMLSKGLAFFEISSTSDWSITLN